MANRWPPWIEARVAATGNLVTGAVPAVVPGCSVTVTPKINARAAIVGVFDVTSAALALFVGKLRVNNVEQAPAALCTNLPVGQRVMLTQVWTYDMTAGVAYAFDLWGQDNAPGSFTVGIFHTGFDLIALPSDGVTY